jgi:SAM-dependent methyltransferase
MTRIAQRNCPICGGGQVDALHTQRFELPKGHPLADGYEVVACAACGFIYADTAVTQAAYDRFYAQFSKYEDAKTGTGGGEKPWDRQRLTDTARQVADFLHNPQARVLDIGCANGGLLKALDEIGYHNLCGLDPSPACVENTRALGLEAQVGSLFQPFEGGEFDCVILSHTLEHVQELAPAMGFVKSVLRKNPAGVLYAEVPDAARYQDFVFAPFQDFNTEHINHFSLAGLENLMRATGFTVVSAGAKLIESSPNMPYPAIYVFARYTPEARESLVMDTPLRERIGNYIAISRRELDGMDARIRTALAAHSRVIVWGTGQLAMKLLAETSLGQANIAVFVDSNPINQGKTLCNVPIVAPEAVRGLPDPIIITSTLHQHSIADQIRRMGLPNPLLFLRDSHE